MKKYLLFLALLAVSCTKVVEIESEPVNQDEVTAILYTVTVSSEQTRATVDDDMMTLRYADGDQLYISCDSREDVKGVLDLVSGSGQTGENGDVVFEGMLSFTGEAPAENLLLNATLVGSKNVGIQIGDDNKVTGIKYPDFKSYCTDLNDAVEKYSLLTGVGTFGSKRFPLSQHTAFLSFSVSAADFNLAGAEFSVFVKNGESYSLLGDLSSTLNEAGLAEVHFTLPMAEGTVLNNASVSLISPKPQKVPLREKGTPGVVYSAPFGGTEKTLDAKVYTVTKVALPSSGYVDTGLPILIINTNDNGGADSITKDVAVDAIMSIQNAGGYNVEQLVCTIKGRGNTTWNWPKKPYLLKLDKKESLLGLSAVGQKSKQWILLANFMDRSMMRNLVAMKLGSIMSNLEWTPNCKPVELYIDGEHRGSYLLIERVRVEDGRVDINKDGNSDNNNDVGFLLELDFHYDNEVQWKDSHGTTKENVSGSKNGIPFAVKEPDWDPADPDKPVNNDQLNYIKNYISDAGSTLFSKQNGSSRFYTVPNPNGYEEYLDVASFIDYWLVFEIMINHELGNPGSVYMYKKRGGKLYAGPCWDFDWGTLSFNWTNTAENSLVNHEAIWYRSLMTDSAYKTALKNRFRSLLKDLRGIPDQIDEWERQLEISAELNFRMWNPAGAGAITYSNDNFRINGDEDLTFHEAVAEIKRIYSKRLDVIESKLNDL